MRLTPLDAESCDAVGLLAAASVTLREVLWGDETETTAPHIAARFDADAAPVAEHSWTLASLVIRRSVGAGAVPSPVLDAAKGNLRESMVGLDGLLEGNITSDGKTGSAGVRRPAARAGLDDAGTLLHEVALEEFEAAVLPATDRDGKLVFAWRPVPEAHTFVELLEPLFESAEHVAAMDPMLAMEHDACTWWFRRWSSRETVRKGGAFATRVRAQEWVLAGRPTLATQQPIMAALLGGAASGRLPGKQRMLARALLASRSSLFIVRERTDERAVLEDIGDRTTVTIHEHSPSTRYRAGDVGAGRVLRIDEHRSVRSPGMVFFPPPEGADSATAIRPALGQARTALGDSAIAVEAVLSVVFGDRVPGNPPAATSSRDARERLEDMNDLLTEAGLSHPVRAEDAPPEMRAMLAAGSGRQVYGYDVDDPIAGYMAALGKRSRGPGGISSAQGAKKKRRRSR